MSHEEIEIETHPWKPYIPCNAKVLIMGTFPPQPKRWSMDFYYPNRTNDFWYMMGLIFGGDRTVLLREGSKDFDLDRIKCLLDEKGIALSDTGRRIRRLAGNASDKFLEIVEPAPLFELLKRMPYVAASPRPERKLPESLQNSPALPHQKWEKWQSVRTDSASGACLRPAEPTLSALTKRQNTTPVSSPTPASSD